jgi:inosose dehydratase
MDADTRRSSGVHCQQYPWFTFFKREGRDWSADLPYSMERFASVGFTGFEPSFASVKEVKDLSPLIDRHKIATGSLYVNSILHEESQTADSISQVLDIAKAAKALGVSILVTNPSPIRWGGDEDKTDSQLITQARALDELGRQLREIGLTLAYHTHDAEMRNGAREFHHMLLKTDPKNVKLCLDAHWIFRGCGNSQVALFDIVALYMDRIVELHLRQSQDGVWTEEFTEGDIDYHRLVSLLKQNEVRPHIVLEQAVEEGTPHTMNGVEAHALGLEYTRSVFKDLL